MKGKVAVIVAVVFFCLVSSAIAEISRLEKIKKLGFPESIAASLNSLVEQNNFSGKIDISKGMAVSAIIRKDVLGRDGKLKWDGNHFFQAEKYETDNFVLYRLENEGEVLFRTGELPPIKEKADSKITRGVEEVFESVALPLDLKNLSKEQITAIVVPIFRSNWIGDGLGMYSISEKDGKESEKFFVRKVWRTTEEDFPAVITKYGTHVFVIAKGKKQSDLLGKNLAIISGSGKFALTLSGKMVEFNSEKQVEFFTEHNSRITEEMLIDISPETENGKAFIRDLKKIFPNDYYVKGKRVSSETDEETLKSLVGSSNNASFARRVVEKGGLPNISISSVLCPPCELIRMLIVWSIAAADDTLTGNFLEAKVSGYQAAQALAPYLAECQEEISYLTKITKK